MAKTSPKRDAVAGQVEELRKQGLKDADIRVFLKRYDLTEKQLDDVLPTTKVLTPVEVRETSRDTSYDRVVISECIEFLKGVPARMGSAQMDPVLMASDARVWAKKLGGLL